MKPGLPASVQLHVCHNRRVFQTIRNISRSLGTIVSSCFCPTKEAVLRGFRAQGGCIALSCRGLTARAPALSVMGVNPCSVPNLECCPLCGGHGPTPSSSAPGRVTRQPVWGQQVHRQQPGSGTHPASNTPPAPVCLGAGWRLGHAEGGGHFATSAELSPRSPWPESPACEGPVS